MPLAVESEAVHKLVQMALHTDQDSLQKSIGLAGWVVVLAVLDAMVLVGLAGTSHRDFADPAVVGMTGSVEAEAVEEEDNAAEVVEGIGYSPQLMGVVGMMCAVDRMVLWGSIHHIDFGAGLCIVVRVDHRIREGVAHYERVAGPETSVEIAIVQAVDIPHPSGHSFGRVVPAADKRLEVVVPNTHSTQKFDQRRNSHSRCSGSVFFQLIFCTLRGETHRRFCMSSQEPHQA